jgi:TetR/AcrR family acrAB operon transcriptional repressor
MRRTKEEALATRSRILDAAERLFAAHGVSRTSLHDIAAAAGVTRGAVYWHFAGKAELFEAMLDRVTLPLETLAGGAGSDARHPLDVVRARFLAPLEVTARDARTRRVFDIALHKAEYTGELHALRIRRRHARADWLVEMERALRLAQRAGVIRAGGRVPTTALALLALVEGLIAHWVLEPRAFDLVGIGTQALDTYLLALAPAAAPRRISAARRS